MKFRFQVAIICTILFAGSWCLSLKSDQIFWLCLSFQNYLGQIGIWFGLFVLIYFILSLARRCSLEYENKLVVFVAIVSLVNLMDYGMRSFFGQVAMWPRSVLFCWATMTILLPVGAAYVALKIHISRTFLEKAIRAGIVPCILLVYYALPSDFTVVEVEKPISSGHRPPVHLILFDMLSYEFLFENSKAANSYPHFESFSRDSECFVNAYSPGSTTGTAVPRLLTGIDLKEIGQASTQWVVSAESLSRMMPISSKETLFSMVGKDGYNIFLRAFAFPYLNNFEKYIQSGRIHPFDALWKGGMHSLVWPIIAPGGIQHQKTVNSILDDYINRVHDNPRNTFFFTHWNIPHDPFIYNKSGNMLSRFELTRQLITSPDRKRQYKSQLVGTDAVLGQLIQAMKDSGTYDESLVIVTSDHNIKGFGFDMKRVPLIIKQPHQNNSNIVHSRVTTLNILNYIEHFIKFGECNSSLLQINPLFP